MPPAKKKYKRVLDVKNVSVNKSYANWKPSGGGGGAKQNTLGALSRTMDVLSRFQYASAGMAKGKGVKESLSMGLKGIQGKKKYSYSDVVKDRLGIRGKPAALLGFLGDVALDPTTYVGVGLAKTAAQQIGKKVTKEVAEEVVQKASTKVAQKGFKEYGEKAAVKATAQPVSKAVVEKAVHKGFKSLGDKAPKAVTPKTVAKTVAKEVATAAPKVAGKAAGKIAKTVPEKVVAKAVKETAEKVVAKAVAEKTGKAATKAVDDTGILLKPKALAKEPMPASGPMPKIAKQADPVLEQADAGLRDRILAARDLATKAAASPTQPLRAVGDDFVGTAAQKTAAKEADDIARAVQRADALPATKIVAGATGAAQTAGTLAAKVASQAAEKAVQAAPQTIKGAKQGARALEFRAFGKTVASSQKAGDVLSKSAGAVGATKLGGKLNQAFRPGHGIDKAAHNLERTYSGQARANVADFGNEIRTVNKGITEAQDKRIWDALQKNSPELLDDQEKKLFDYYQVQLKKMDVESRDIEKLEKRLGMLEKKVERARTPETAAKHASDLKRTQSKIDEGGKFKEKFKYKGGPQHKRASVNLLLDYEEHTRKRAWADFLDEATTRFPHDIDKIKDHAKDLNQIFGIKGENPAFWGHYMNEIQGRWKRYVTAYRPGFHIKNSAGDAMLNYLAGVKNPRAYDWAFKTLTGKNKDNVLRGIGKKTDNYTTADMETLYRQGGLETSYMQSDEITRPVKGLSKKITDAGDFREKVFRMANFTDAFSKARKRGLGVDDAVEEASARVRKFNFDYTDLTPTERKLRGVLPFYTWTRKAMPVMLEHTLSNPGKILAIPKGTRALEGLLGVEHDPDDPFPGLSEALPEWLQDKGIIQMGGDSVMSPDPPTNLLANLSPAHAIKDAAGMVSPFIKAPLELATGKSFPEGIDQKENLVRYLIGQFAPYGNVARSETDTSIKERLRNILTGAGHRDLNK